MTRHARLLGTTAFAALFALAAPAMAEMSDYDSNADMQIDNTEFSTGMDERGTYDTWDSDADGMLSMEELENGVHTRRDKLNMTDEEWNMGESDWDTNADENVDRDEFNAGVYSSYDTNQDGMIDEEEYGAYESEVEAGTWD